MAPTLGRGQAGKAPDSGSGDRGFESYRPSHCSVSGHPGLLLQDIVDRPSAAEAEVEAVGVELELADELSVGGEDADVGGGDEEVHLAVAVLDADADVAETSQVADGDAAVGVDLVLADPVVSGGGGQPGGGFGAGVGGGERGAAGKGAVRGERVAVAAEG